MRTNVTSGIPLSLCVSLCAVMLLISVGDRAYAKRGCSAFGHSCFGGHGKRFDPNLHSLRSDNDISRDQEYEAMRMSNEPFAIGSEQTFQGQEVRPFPQARRQASQRLDPYTLSLFVGQWLASHRRHHHPELEVNKK